MWLWNGQPVETHDDLHPDCSDFVYIIEYTNGQKYIGKKTIKSIRKKPPLKGKKRCRRILTKHPFVNYEGSMAKGLGLEIKHKIIIYQCSTKKAATYLETALLFESNAIFEDEFLNKNISGVFYDNDLNGLLLEDGIF